MADTRLISVFLVEVSVSGWNDPKLTYIGRRHPRIPLSVPGGDGRWGNPWIVARGKRAIAKARLRGFKTAPTAEKAVQLYDDYLVRMIRDSADFAARLRLLDGRTLVCWCGRNKGVFACHGHALMFRASQLASCGAVE